MAVKFSRIKEYNNVAGYYVAEFDVKLQNQEEFSDKRVESFMHVQEGIARNIKVGDMEQLKEYKKAFKALIQKHQENPENISLITFWQPSVDELIWERIQEEINNGTISQKDFPFCSVAAIQPA